MAVELDARKVLMVGEDGTIIPHPATESGTPISVVNIIPPGYYYYATGAFDDIATPAKGAGAQIAISRDGAGNTQLSGRFLEHVYVIQGGFACINAEHDDWVQLDLKSPASAPTSTPGTGNADKIPLGGGANIITPATNGDWTVDGSTLEAGEINQDLSPVPAYDSDGNPNGWWDWDPTQTPSLITNLTQTGHFNLFDFPIPLARQANRLPALLSGAFTPPTMKGKKILPHWEWHFCLTRGSQAGTVKAACFIGLARKSTV
jgi:hypothetical protein